MNQSLPLIPKFKPGDFVAHVCHRAYDSPYMVLASGIMEDASGVKEVCYTVTLLLPQPHRLFIPEIELKPIKENT